MNRMLPLYLCLLLLTQCGRDPEPANPQDALPPATQSGAHTFGCLLNGRPWTPRGGTGLTGNYSVVVDPAYYGGNLSIRATRYTGALFQSIRIGGDSVARAGNYPFTVGPRGAGFTDLLAPISCQSFGGVGQHHQGTLNITRYDLQAGIVSGTFNFVLAKPGCDTVKVTHGRFDYKL